MVRALFIPNKSSILQEHKSLLFLFWDICSHAIKCPFNIPRVWRTGCYFSSNISLSHSVSSKDLFSLAELNHQNYPKHTGLQVPNPRPQHNLHLCIIGPLTWYTTIPWLYTSVRSIWLVHTIPKIYPDRKTTFIFFLLNIWCWKKSP